MKYNEMNDEQKTAYCKHQAENQKLARQRAKEHQLIISIDHMTNEMFASLYELIRQDKGVK